MFLRLRAGLRCKEYRYFKSSRCIGASKASRNLLTDSIIIQNKINVKYFFTKRKEEEIGKPSLFR